MENYIISFLALRVCDVLLRPSVQEKIVMKVLYYCFLYVKEKRKKEKPVIVVIEREGDWEEVLNPNQFSDRFAG